MTTQQLLMTGWFWDPIAAALCAAIAGAACWIVLRGRSVRFARGEGREGNPALLWLGVAIVVLALLSPIATLAKSYLFSAHMLQHLLLLLVAPPLFLLGLPDWSFRESRLPVRDRASGRVLATPITWAAGVGAMWLWHVPFLCDAATTRTAVYHFQTVSLLVMGAMFWWPIAGPAMERRLSPLPGIAYLVSACFACTLLGIYVTFSPISVCSIYMRPADSLGILPLIRNSWGMTHEVDQQVGGLMMWVPACLLYLCGVIGLLARWYSGTESVLPEARPVSGTQS